MAPRRARKLVKVTKNSDYTNLKLTKVMCPICRTILMEPVSLPCNHNFCLSCFESTMANANLVCPLCRVRVGSWLRNAKKENTLVNNELWKAIKDQFPLQVKNKLEGIDEPFEEDEKPLIKIASPGEIRKEYQIQKQAEEAELQKQRELEAKASEELIRKLTEEEEHEKSVMEEKIRFDREIAKQIAKNLCSEAGPSNLKPIKRQVPLDRFLKQKEFTSKILCQKSTKVAPKAHLQIQRIAGDAAETSDGSDSIESECRYFKPIDYKSIPPSKALSPIKIPSKMANAATVIIGAPQGVVQFNHNSLRSAFTALRCSSLFENHDKVPAMKNKRRNGSLCTETSIPRPSKRPSIRSDEVLARENKRKTSPILNSSPKKRIVPVLQRRASKLERLSPPCYGFDVSERNSYADRLLEHVISKDVMSSGVVEDGGTLLNNNWETEALKRKLQEQADLEFAKKLQAELNSDGYGRYSTRQGCAKSKNRQVTIDEIIKSQCKVGL